MDYNDYYEHDFEGETLVSLDYADPEPSLYKVSRGQQRPQMSTFPPTNRMSKLRKARGNSRAQQQRFDNGDDYRDDFNGSISSRRAPSDNRSVSSRRDTSGRTLASRQTQKSNGSQRVRTTSQRSNTSQRSSITSKTSRKTMDLTTPESDSSFALFAQLLVQHIESKLNGDQYILEPGDMSYFEAILPEALRLPFVEAVRIRADQLPLEADGNETELEMSVRKCAELGIGYSDENNFLLGGGQQIRGGKIVIRLEGHGDKLQEEEKYHEDSNRISEAEAEAQIEAAYGRRDRAKNRNKASNIEKQNVPWEDEEKAEDSSESLNAPEEPQVPWNEDDESTSKSKGSSNIGNSQKNITLSPQEALAQITAARQKSSKTAARQKSSKQKSRTKVKRKDHPLNDISEHLMKSENEAIYLNEEERDGNYQPPMEILDDASVAMSSLGSATSSSRQSITSSRRSLASSRAKNSKPNIVSRHVSNGSLLEGGELLNKEALLADTIDEETPVKEPMFDLSVRKTEEAQARAKDRRKKKKSRKMKTKSMVAGTISVNTSPSDLDMTAAAFENEWRDGLLDIFSHGVCHPHLFLSFVAPIFALGQVMTRLHLNWIGVPQTKVDAKDNFYKLGMLVGCWLNINIVTVSLCVFLYHAIYGFLEPLLFLCVMSNFCFYGFCIFAAGNTRKYLRNIYNIHDTPESDYLLAAVYMPFTVSQMLRHTADYNTLQARVCSTSGLTQEADFSFITNMGTFGNGSYGSYTSFGDEEVSVSVSSRFAGSVSKNSVGASTYSKHSVGASTYSEYDGSVASSYA